jgi:hypothetical protein
MRESLAGYLALQWGAEAEGPAFFRAQLWEAIRRYENLVGTPDDWPLSKLPASAASGVRQVLLEDKGVLVFHMLRKQLGDEVFLRAVQRWVAQPERSWKAFLSAAETEGKVSLSEFVAQWMDRPGRPEFAISEVTVEPAGQGFAVRGKVAQVGEPFALRLPLVLSTTGQARIYHLDVSRGEVDFKLLTPDRPVRLRVDPAHDWLLKAPGSLELGS